MASILPLAMGMLPICGLVYVMDGIFVGSEEYSFLAQAMYVSAGATLVTLATVQKFDLGTYGGMFGKFQEILTPNFFFSVC